MTATIGILENWLSWQLSGLWALTLLAPMVWLLDRWWAIRLGPKWLVIAWGVVFLRAMIPLQVGVLSSPAPDFQAMVGASVAASGPAAVSAVSWLLMAFAFWIAGALMIAALLVRNHRRWRAQLLVTSRPANEELLSVLTKLAARNSLKVKPELRVSNQVSGPLVTGARRPIIVVPSASERQPDTAETAMMLAHELTHIRRRDPLLQAIALSFCCLFWVHPLIWIARGRLQGAQEGWCDTQAIQLAGVDAQSYRQLLIRHLAHSEGIHIAGLKAPVAMGMSASSVLHRAIQLGEQTRGGLKIVYRITCSAMLVLLLACSTLVATTDPVQWMAQQNPGDLPGSIAKRYAVMAQISARRDAALQAEGRDDQ